MAAAITLLIRVWGQINSNAELTVDRDGMVYILPVGRRWRCTAAFYRPAIYELKDQKETSYRRPLYWSREPKELEAGARMPNGRTVDSTAKWQLISNRTWGAFRKKRLLRSNWA